MAISQVPASSSQASLQSSLQTAQKTNQITRLENDKSGKTSYGRSKAEEEKAIAAASAAAGVGSKSLQQVGVEAAGKAEKESAVSTRASGRVRTVDQDVREVARNGGNETSSKVQQLKQDILAASQQKAKAADQARNTKAQDELKAVAAQQNAQQQRSSASVLQLARNQQNAEFEARKQQNVQIKPVEKLDVRVVNNKQLSERVQKNQEVAQTEKFRQIADTQTKANVTKNDQALKEAVKGAGETAKPRPPAEARSPVGQNVNIKA